MGIKKRTIQAIAVVLVLGSFSAASAAITTYTDRSTWATAAGSTDFTVNFESFASDTSFATLPLNLGPFSLSTVGPAPGGTDFISVSPGTFPAGLGNVAAEFFVQSPLAADLLFTNPVRGFFADFLFAGNGQQLDLTLSFSGGGTADILVPGTGTGLQPFGFISTTNTVTGIRFNNSVNDGFYIDNVSGNLAASSVPEPGSLTLLFLGLAGLVACRRSAVSQK